MPHAAARPTPRWCGVDIDIRAHNRAAIEAHPMFKRITLMQGSSVAPDVVEPCVPRPAASSGCWSCLDSNHTHDHVLAELQAYAPMTSVGSYCIVFDTVVEDLPADMFPDRPWGPGDNPKTAVWEYLKQHPGVRDRPACGPQAPVSVAPSGYLKRVR